jgi:hypothetical protein
MKCPRCWTDKGYLRRVSWWKQLALICLLLRPMKCHHCYHKFVVPWLLTLGKQVTPPRLRIAPISREAGPSLAAQSHVRLTSGPTPVPGSDEGHSRWADAA